MLALFTMCCGGLGGDRAPAPRRDLRPRLATGAAQGGGTSWTPVSPRISEVFEQSSGPPIWGLFGKGKKCFNSLDRVGAVLVVLMAVRLVWRVLHAPP